MLQPIADGLWIADDEMPLFLRGVELPRVVGAGTTRMTVVRLASGALLLHSPVRPTPALVDAVRALGPVAFVVAPCVMHTTYARPWHEQLPEAALHVAPRTAKRAPPLAGLPELSDDAPLARDELPQLLIAGHRNYETLFFHAASRTLIVTDLGYGVARRAGVVEKAWLTANGVRSPLGVTGYSRRAVTKPDLFAARMRRVLEWDFDRVVMSHGDVVERGGKEAFARAWRL